MWFRNALGRAAATRRRRLSIQLFICQLLPVSQLADSPAIAVDRRFTRPAKDNIKVSLAAHMDVGSRQCR